MKNIIRWILAFAAVTILMPSMPFGIQADVLSAQTACGAGVSGCARTTLSSALAAGNKNNLVSLASTTGITASTTSITLAANTGGQQFCLIDHELVLVRLVNTTTNIITVNRAVKGVAAGHISGAQVICGGNGSWDQASGNSRGIFLGTGNFQPSGSCTRTSQQFLPIFSISSEVRSGWAYDCLGGKWVQGTFPDAPDSQALVHATNVAVGSVAYASFGNNTTGVATVEWLTSIMVNKTGFINSVGVLCGGTCTTDKILVTIRDSTGNLIANSATAGQLLSGANTFQSVALTAKVYLVGAPGGTKYFVGVQTNGTTAGDLSTVAASTFVDVVTGQLTGGTFGTIVASATMPTTFTANQGPIVELVY